jgi:hypothetical protein
VAPVTGVTEYVCEELWHTDVTPEIAPGWEGTGVTVTANVLGKPPPQTLFAIAEIVPSAFPVVTVMEFVVDVPVQPVGNVQV